MIDRERKRIRDQLAKFAHQVRALAEKESQLLKVQAFPRSIDLELSDLVAGAIEKYLSGEASMDRALGLVRPGPPSRRGKSFRIARDEIGWRLAQGKKFREIWLELDGDQSEDSLRKMWDQEKQYVLEEYSRLLQESQSGG